MTYTPTHRPHLVERAVQAFGGTDALGKVGQIPPPPASNTATTAPEELLLSPLEVPSSPETAPAPTVIGWDALKRAGLVVCETGPLRSRFSEEISIVQQQLLMTMKKVELTAERCAKAVLVTSARPGEGKSFTSINVGAGIAAAGAHRVLLVDADGKLGSLTELLGLSEAPGLRLLAAGKGPLQPASLVLPTAQPRLSFLPYGTSIKGEPVLPPGPMVAAAILRLAAALPDHVIILDSPPCLATSDPGTLASIVSQVLMVVEAERTQRSEVEAALDLVDACPILQLVLNRTQLVASDSFGAYGSYDVYGTHGP